MFGHDGNNDKNQDFQGHPGQVTPPADPAQDDLDLDSEVSISAAPSATPTIDSRGGGYLMDPVPPSQGGSGAVPPPPPSTPEQDDLLNIKQQALQQLAPLVGHLEQSPEEKFRTLMMMIQASDDQTKLKEAYDIAQQITDEKVRAQALLDVVNEINYFTQQHKS